jgi:hypothetical protein
MRKSREILVSVILGSAVVVAAYMFHRIIDGPWVDAIGCDEGRDYSGKVIPQKPGNHAH